MNTEQIEYMRSIIVSSINILAKQTPRLTGSFDNVCLLRDELVKLEEMTQQLVNYYHHAPVSSPEETRAAINDTKMALKIADELQETKEGLNSVEELLKDIGDNIGWIKT